MAGIVGGSMGPGSPNPIAFNYRRPTLGKPSVSYEAKSNQTRTTVGQGRDNTKLGADFQFRPPVRSPGQPGLGDRGSFVDAQA
jgi:hypothetical protein